MKRRIPVLFLVAITSFNAWGAAIFDIEGSVDWNSWSVTQGGTDLNLYSGSVRNYTHAHVADEYVTYSNWGSNSIYGPPGDPWQDVSIGYTTPIGSASGSVDGDSLDVSVSGLNYYTNTESGLLDTGSIAQRDLMRYVLDNATDAITISADYAVSGSLSTDVVGDAIYASNTFFDIMAILQDSGSNSIMGQINAEYRPGYRVEDGEDLIFSDSGTLSLVLDPSQYPLTGDPVYVYIRAELRAYGYAETNEGTPVPVTSDVPAPGPLALIGLGLVGLALTRRVTRVAG